MHIIHFFFIGYSSFIANKSVHFGARKIAVQNLSKIVQIRASGFSNDQLRDIKIIDIYVYTPHVIASAMLPCRRNAQADSRCPPDGCQVFMH